MILKSLREAGLTSDLAYGAAAASILLSIGVWATEKDRDTGHAERFGIFIGLWAPTFAILGHALEDEKIESTKQGFIRAESGTGTLPQ